MGPGLLFLPAAGARYDTGPATYDTLVFCWSQVGLDSGNAAQACFANNWLNHAYSRRRSCLAAIRLASRQGLSGGSISVSGCLFLPEAAIYYWSVSSRADAREYICEAFRVQTGILSSAFGQWRFGKFSIRLASR